MKHYELIAQQCINQGATSPEEVARFAEAYFDACAPDFDPEIPDHDDIIRWARLIDPRNIGYRTIPVRFRNGNTGLAPEHIARQMEILCMLMDASELTPEEAYREFETIHPFIDGNGRVGHLVWAAYTEYKTGKWPDTLPPELEWTK